MSQVVAVIFPSISDVIVHNHGLRSRALVPSDSTQHFVLYLQRLVLFQLHLRDVDRPSRVTTAPRIVELQAQTIGISVTEKNLYLAVVYLDFSRPGRSGSDRFVVEVGTKIRIHGSLVIGRCRHTHLERAGDIASHYGKLASLHFHRALITGSGEDGYLNRIAVGIHKFQFAVFNGKLTGIGTVIPFVAIGRAAQYQLIVGNGSIGHRCP